MIRHTPGPWRLESTTLEICRLIVSIEEVSCEAVLPSNGNETIAYVPTNYSKETQLANAKLIAAAPALADALENLLHAIRRGEGEEEAKKNASAALRAAGRLP